MNRPRLSATLATSLAFAAAHPSLAATRDVTVAVTLKDHNFTPAQIKVPAGVKVRIDLTNLDSATEEFDSHDLKVEQLVTPHGHTSFSIGPLRPGTYSFMGEFHPTTAQGHVTAS